MYRIEAVLRLIALLMVNGLLHFGGDGMFWRLIGCAVVWLCMEVFVYQKKL